MPQPHPPFRDAILERTAQGQLQMVQGKPRLSTVEWRLLGMVNGYTSLHCLMDLLPEEHVEQAAHRLLAAGLARHAPSSPGLHWDHPHLHPWSC